MCVIDFKLQMKAAEASKKLNRNLMKRRESAQAPKCPV